MTKSDDILDDQALGSFVDGLLDAAHSETIIKAMEDNPEIRERVYQLRRAKDLMRLGFGDTSTSSGNTAKAKLRHWKLFSPEIAASIAVLVVSFGAGILGHGYYDEPMSGVVGETVSSAHLHQPEKVILHISESDPARFSTVLEYTEKFLQEHQGEGDQIEVVAHAGGLDLMRTDVSPFKEQILEMISKYNNVHFFGCANAIRMLQNKGINPAVISGIETNETTFEHIVSRLQTGDWKYIKVESIKNI